MEQNQLQIALTAAIVNALHQGSITKGVWVDSTEFEKKTKKKRKTIDVSQSFTLTMIFVS